MTHPSACGAIAANVAETTFMIAIRCTETHFLNRLIDNQSFCIVVNDTQTITAHMQQPTNWTSSWILHLKWTFIWLVWHLIGAYVLFGSANKSTLTLSTFIASSHTFMPRDSNTSTQPRYLTGNEHVAERTACSSVGHCSGFVDSGTRSFRRRNESRNDRRMRSIFFGDLLLSRNEAANLCFYSPKIERKKIYSLVLFSWFNWKCGNSVKWIKYYTIQR